MERAMGRPASRHESHLIIILLILITAAVYWQVAGFPLLRLDDRMYVQQNPLVESGLTPLSVQQALTAPYIDNYIPLVWISYMIDHDIGSELFNSEAPGVYHVTNLVLHLANTVLLFVLLVRLTGSRWRGAFVAALFAIHPLHVESVAWVAERKDVLSTLFWLLTTLAYLRYVERPDSRRWITLTVLFLLGLMSKPMLVTLPLTLLLLDFWPLGRMAAKGGSASVTWAGFKEMATEKIPLFALALAACVVTILSQRHAGAVADLGATPLGERLANAVVTYWTYIARMFWPADLCCMYIHPGNTLPVWKTIGSGVLLAATTVATIRYARRWPYLCFGWLWYVITLLPVIGIVQVGWQGSADRYTYVSLIGIFIMIAWGLPDLLSRGRGELGTATARALGAAVVIIAVLMPLTYKQIGCWRDEFKLYAQALRIDPNNAFAHNNVGSALAAKGDVTGAIREWAKAVKARPDYIKARCNLASNLCAVGRVDEGIRHLRTALEQDPRYVPARECLGAVLVQRGQYDEAIMHFKAALEVDPYNAAIQERLDAAEAQKMQAE